MDYNPVFYINFGIMIARIIEKSIQDDLFKGKAIIVTGPRQVGKTTLLEKLNVTNKVKKYG
jgi:predicted AAA+ superfamily ATPase